MRKNRIRLTESQLHRLIKNSIKHLLAESVSDIPSHKTGGSKYYVNDAPIKNGYAAGDYDTDGYMTKISPDEFEDLSSYDDGFGYDFEEPNEEPVCCDPLEGPCYDTGDYSPKDDELQKSFAQYAHHVSDVPSSVKRQQMNADWYRYTNDIPKDESIYDMNWNVFPNDTGKAAMNALEDPNGFATKMHRSTLRDLLKKPQPMSESKLRHIIKESIIKVLNETTPSDFDEEFGEKLRDTKDDERVALKDFNNDFDKSLTQSKQKEYQNKNAVTSFDRNFK